MRYEGNGVPAAAVSCAAPLQASLHLPTAEALQEGIDVLLHSDRRGGGGCGVKAGFGIRPRGSDQAAAAG